MPNYVITTDSTVDMPREYLQKNQVPCLGLSFSMAGIHYVDDENCPLSPEQFYSLVRQGQMPVTAQANMTDFIQMVEPLLAEGKDVLHIAFSSGLSGSLNSYNLGAQDLLIKYPDRKIVVVDSLCASMGEGLLLYYALENWHKGMGLEENAQWLEDNKLHLCHWFTVDDLHHLHRGGRVSKASAILGSLMGIKPVLHVDDQGHLLLIEKVRGRMASLSAMVRHMAETAFDPKDQMVFISHGDCLEDAKKLETMVRKQLGVKRFMINTIGPVIGTHSGPGTLALFFLGSKR